MKRLKIFSVIGFIILSTFFIQACSKSNDYNPSGGVGTTPVTVTIQSMQFTPATITVGLGTIVTWKNLDTDLHTVTSDDATSFSSGNLSTNGTYSFTCTSYGSFPYHCSLHPGMTGTIQVVTR